jgi:hypothetical protein
MIKHLSLIATILGAGMVSMAFMNAGQFWIAGLVLISFIIISFMSARRMDWIHSPSLFLIIGYTAVGLFQNLEPGLLYSGMICSLAGWDLADFSIRIRQVEQQNNVGELLRSHLVRLGKVLAVGIGIMIVAFNLKVTPAFAWVSVMAILVTIGLGSLVSRLIKHD